jgi:hypothetical protein
MKARSLFSLTIGFTILCTCSSVVFAELRHTTPRLDNSNHPASTQAQSTIISQNIAPQKFIDIWTHNIFYSLHPELSNRKIQSFETEYIREWQAIEIVIANNLTYQMGCTGRGWGLSEYDHTNVRTGKRLLTSTVLDKVADAVFYTRHPELGDRKIQPGEYKLTNEWMMIRQAIWTLPWC